MKNFVMNIAMGLFAFASTTGLINFVRAANCGHFCDDQVEWVKYQQNGNGTVLCKQYGYRFQRFLNTDDANYNAGNVTEGSVTVKIYPQGRCNPTCENPQYPVKADGSPEGDPLDEYTAQNQLCTMSS